jgi:hypothetical protein
MRKQWVATMTLCITLSGTPAFAQDSLDDMGGSGVLSVRVDNLHWGQLAGRELQGWVDSPEGSIEGSLSATVPEQSTEPTSPGTDPAGWAWESSLTARLDLDGEPVHLAPDIYTLTLTLGEPGCWAGWNTTCYWWCQTTFELRPDEDIWFNVNAFREVELPGGIPAAGHTCPVDFVSHREWSISRPAE